MSDKIYTTSDMELANQLTKMTGVTPIIDKGELRWNWINTISLELTTRTLHLYVTENSSELRASWILLLHALACKHGLLYTETVPDGWDSRLDLAIQEVLLTFR